MMNVRAILFWLLCSFLANGQVTSLEAEDLDLATESIYDEFAQQDYESDVDYTNRLFLYAEASFEKMRFAQSARLFDKAIANKNVAPTIDMIQMAGDANYLSGAMDKAAKWYEKLEEIQGDSMTNETIYKFSKVLKSTGRNQKAGQLNALLQEKWKTVYLNSATKTNALAQSKDGIKILENLNSNTADTEFAPIILNGTDLVFASNRGDKKKSQKKLGASNAHIDLYQGTILDEKYKVEEIEKLTNAINSKYHEASVAFSPEGTTMYFTRSSNKKIKQPNGEKTKLLKIYKSNFENNQWSKPEELSINNNKYSNSHPTISPDGTKMIFASDRSSSMGETDLFMVTINEDGTFSEPENLGEVVNSTQKEIFPYFNGNTLYFSSDRELGVGGLDIYKSEYSNGKFTPVVNLGAPINSDKNDFSYILKQDNETGYFASNRDGGKGGDDIYYFAMGERPIYDPSISTIDKAIVRNALIKKKDLTAVEKSLAAEKIPTIIIGVVSDDETGEVVPNAVIKIFDENEKYIGQIQSDDLGSFEFTRLYQYNNYVLIAEHVDYKVSTPLTIFTDIPEKNINIRMYKGNEAYVEDEMIAEDAPAKPKVSPVLETNVKPFLKQNMIYFGFDKHLISASAKAQMDELLTLWEQFPNMKIKIESHTDSRGKASYNKWLSQKRANATKDYLVSQGISPELIVSATGYGEEQLLNECSDGVVCDRKTHRINRRSEFIILDY